MNRCLMLHSWHPTTSWHPTPRDRRRVYRRLCRWRGLRKWRLCKWRLYGGRLECKGITMSGRRVLVQRRSDGRCSDGHRRRLKGTLWIHV